MLWKHSFLPAWLWVYMEIHDLHQVRRLRKRVLVLDHGKLIDDYRPAPGGAA